MERADIKRGAGTSLWLSRTAKEKQKLVEMWNEQRRLFDASSSLHHQSRVKEGGGGGLGGGCGGVGFYKLTLPNVPNSAARLMIREECQGVDCNSETGTLTTYRTGKKKGDILRIQWLSLVIIIF